MTKRAVRGDDKGARDDEKGSWVTRRVARIDEDSSGVVRCGGVFRAQPGCDSEEEFKKRG